MSHRSAAMLAVSSLAGAAIAFSTPIAAHHSFATEFDVEKPVEVQGIVTKAQFVNPHSWIYVDVKNANGTRTNWGFEFGSPGTLAARKVTKADVRAGTTVRITGYRSKNTGPFGYAQTVQLSDGRTVQIGGAPDAPSARRKS